MQAQEAEFASCKDVCDMYLAKEEAYKSEIEELRRQNAELQKRLKNETWKLTEKYQLLQVSSKKELGDVNLKHKKYAELVKIEIECLKQIAKESSRERQEFVLQIREIQAILRTKRLSRIYYEKVENLNRLKEQYRQLKFQYVTGQEHKEQVLKDW